MAIVTLQGPEPFVLELQKPPTAASVDESVLLTLHVFAPDFPASVAHVEIPLSLDDARQLAGQLQPAIRMAEVRSRGR